MPHIDFTNKDYFYNPLGSIDLKGETESNDVFIATCNVVLNVFEYQINSDCIAGYIPVDLNENAFRVSVEGGNLDIDMADVYASISNPISEFWWVYNAQDGVAGVSNDQLVQISSTTFPSGLEWIRNTDFNGTVPSVPLNHYTYVIDDLLSGSYDVTTDSEDIFEPNFDSFLSCCYQSHKYPTDCDNNFVSISYYTVGTSAIPANHTIKRHRVRLNRAHFQNPLIDTIYDAGWFRGYRQVFFYNSNLQSITTESTPLGPRPTLTPLNVPQSDLVGNMNIDLSSLAGKYFSPYTDDTNPNRVENASEIYLQLPTSQSLKYDDIADDLFYQENTLTDINGTPIGYSGAWQGSRKQEYKRALNQWNFCSGNMDSEWSGQHEITDIHKHYCSIDTATFVGYSNFAHVNSEYDTRLTGTDGRSRDTFSGASPTCRCHEMWYLRYYNGWDETAFLASMNAKMGQELDVTTLVSNTNIAPIVDIDYAITYRSTVEGGSLAGSYGDSLPKLTDANCNVLTPTARQSVEYTSCQNIFGEEIYNKSNQLVSSWTESVNSYGCASNGYNDSIIVSTTSDDPFEVNINPVPYVEHDASHFLVEERDQYDWTLLENKNKLTLDACHTFEARNIGRLLLNGYWFGSNTGVFGELYYTGADTTLNGDTNSGPFFTKSFGNTNPNIQTQAFTRTSSIDHTWVRTYKG